MIGQTLIKIRPYTLPLIWMALIFAVSGDLGSTKHTSRFLIPLIRLFFSEISSDTLSGILFAIRKSAHLFEYAVLAILWFRVLSTKNESGVRHPLIMALLFSGACAGLDELHQAFVKSRGGSITDVGIDTFGALLGLGLWKGIQTFRVPHRMNNQSSQQ